MFSVKKMCLNMSSVKWQPFSPGGDELTTNIAGFSQDLMISCLMKYQNAPDSFLATTHLVDDFHGKLLSMHLSHVDFAVGSLSNDRSRIITPCGLLDLNWREPHHIRTSDDIFWKKKNELITGVRKQSTCIANIFVKYLWILTKHQSLRPSWATIDSRNELVPNWWYRQVSNISHTVVGN